MTFSYSAYGLSIRTDLPLPGLLESQTRNKTDLQIWLAAKSPYLEESDYAPETVWYRSPEDDDAGKPALTVVKLAGGAYFRLNYSDGTTFLIDSAATVVWASWPDTLSREDTATYLLGPVLGFVLRLRGITCLHASAVAIGKQAIALVGPAGAGKSTTAAAFAKRGNPVLTDDVAPLVAEGEALRVLPGYPRVCLWPESVGSLYGSPEALPRLTPNWEKCYLPLEDSGRRFQDEPLPLAAIYLLGERSSDPRAPLVEQVPLRTGLMTLVQNTYMNYLLDKPQRALEFKMLGHLLARVALRGVQPHADPARLSQLCDVIVEDFRAVSPAALAATQAHPA